MIGQRQIGFRQEYRSRILGWYHGYVHVVIIYAMGAAAFYVYVAHIHAVTALEWLTVPLTFLFTNVFEWAIHRYVMHRHPREIVRRVMAGLVPAIRVFALNDLKTRRAMPRSSRGLVARQFRLVERHLFPERLGNARPRLEGRVVVLDRRIGRQIDLCRHRPVQDRIEICIGDAKAVEQILPARAVAAAAIDVICGPQKS